MAKNVVIIPESGSQTFENNGVVKGGLYLDNSDKLIISASTINFSSPNIIEIGAGGGDLYVGDGVNLTDIIFEQNGSIKGVDSGGVTLTLGSPNTNLVITGSAISIPIAPSNFSSQTANTFLSAPNGTTGTPTFRSIVTADIPNLDASKITTGTIDAARLPSYVDDVLEYTNLAGFPATGETGKIYVTLDTNKIYRWSGSAYIEISAGVGTTWGGISGTLSNQTDLQNALNLKANLASPTFTGTVTAPTFVGALTGNASTATNVAYSGLTGTVPTWNQNTTGNAASATILATARTINGVSFDGSANITVADSTKLPLAGGTMSGAITFAAGQTWPTFNQSTTGNAATATNVAYSGLTGTVPTWNQSTTGNAATATTLATARTLTIGSTGKTFNGSANVAWSLAEIGAQAALTNPVTGTGTLYKIAKFTSTGATIGDSMIYDSGTYVGIGTTMPNAKLDIVDTMSAPTLRIAYVPAGGYGGGGNIDFVGGFSDFVSGNISWKNGTTVKAQISYSSTGVMTLKALSTIDLQTVSTSRIYIDSTGGVGIGTTLPGSKLSVGLRASVDGNIRLSAAGTGTNAGASLLWDMQVGGGAAISHLAEIRPESYATGANKNILNFYVGLWNNSADSGTAKMTIAENGNVGIGTINPNFPLSFGTGLGNKIALYDAGSGNGYGFGIQTSLLQIFSNASGDDITFGYGNSTALTRNVTFKGTGNVGIGTTNPLKKLDIVSSTNDSFDAIVVRPTNQTQTLNIGWEGIDASYNFIVKAGGSERMRITTTGNVGIGITDPGTYKLYVAGTIYATGDVIAYSDESVKENIRPIENVIEKIQSTRGIIYDRTDNETKNNIGFIAQELEVAFPELVVTNEDGTKAVKYQNAVAVLFEAIKEQQKQIDAILKLLDNGTSK